MQLPLFSCYVFARFLPNRAERLNVLRVSGVLGLVGSSGEGSPIPDQQIDRGPKPWLTGLFRGLRFRS